MTYHKLDPVELNNIAVQHLEHSNISVACKILATAVRLILNTPINYYSDSKISNYIRFQWSKVAYEINQAPNRNHIPGSTFMFSRAIILYDCCTTRKMTFQHLCSDAKTAIVYNAGLAFHLAAMENNDSTFLPKARTTYILSQTILRKASENGITSTLCFDYDFHVILLNNLGQTSYELVDYDASSYYFEKLFSNLNHIASRTISNNIFENSDMVGMTSNVIVDVPNAAPCA
eukprot:CAMPEP_0194263050 /NCGR_PEP_ID=MMETSP0158-20130606/46857_1 /TAXON_ID=33649 /ORGANISM="Thalassionema nitzschioides, Strain L26-B" /LENGTH=231 /DNA_ID=CAMNT_0039003217 /DNA_START=53 /DNA_END=748 /DNA_ORIENTATION=-